jgi:hypothetical protein
VSGSSALATTRRTGVDWEPVVRQPVGTLGGTVILGTGPETVAAWAELRSRRPDGIPAEVCLVASRTVAGASARRELGCQPRGIGVGVPQLLARTTGGGSMLTWSVPVAQGLGATAFARLPGSDDWSAASLAVGGARGGTQIEALQTVSGSRTALVAQILTPTTAGDLGRLQLSLLGPGGAVLNRALGPRTPGKPRTFSTTYLPIGSAAPHGVLSWPLATGRYRVSLIDLAG